MIARIVYRRQRLFTLSAATALMLAGQLVATGLFADEPNASPLIAAPVPTGSTYGDLILRDGPVAYWSFQNGDRQTISNNASPLPNQPALDADFGKQPLPIVSGPDRPLFPFFNDANNTAYEFREGLGWIRIADPGDNSPLDFDNGDAMTLEAWVNPDFPKQSGAYLYVIGKGRTETSGKNSLNQNYGLRLVTRLTGNHSAEAGLSFLFRSRDDEATGYKGDWHRWTSKKKFSIGDGWHHIALSYKFGEPKSIAGYIDGEPTGGTWDKTGATKQAPVVSNDEVWLGTAMEQNPASSFVGAMDEVAIYRRALTAKQIKSHFRIQLPELAADWSKVTDERVQVNILENIHDQQTWKFRTVDQTDGFKLDRFAFPDIPPKYNSRGILVDRSDPFIMQALARVQIPAGPQKFVVRARNASRLFIDGKPLAKTGYHNISGTAHGTVFEPDKTFAPHVRLLHRGDKQAVFEFEGDGQLHEIRFEMVVGGRSHRPDYGETLVAIAPADSNDNFSILAPQADHAVPLTDARWEQLRKQHRKDLTELNARRRRIASADEDHKWEQRHVAARQIIEKQETPAVPAATPDMRANNNVDHFVNAMLAENNFPQAEQLDDFAFLRKLALDTQGTVPTLKQVRAFIDDTSTDRRAQAIDRFLNEPGWADHWVSYWQDVLAENPNIINPTLNNTGPFRVWIHESFYDNKPFDRLVTELIRMEGSARYGGPAGFEVATQNDAPMAAKAHVLGQAFLGLNMKCARCHDAPAHEFLQRDLFSLAAMLKRSPQQVPKSSSIPGFDFESNSLVVEVTLKPGTKVEPNWPFEDLVDGESLDAPADQKEALELFRHSSDSREEMALLFTNPKNTRFAQVIANRLWKRYLGMGLVEPVDDWNGQPAMNAELLDWLAYQFVDSGYDVKAMARLIFNSDLYQRQATTDWATATAYGSEFRFESPVLRQMTAEQIVDSLFAVCGKELNAGPMNVDIDGARDFKNSINLGYPERAWEFASLSNERDRPSLSLPFAQPFVSFMQTFGWRDTRQDPLTERERESTPGRPAIIQNGILSQRFVRCSDDSAFTQLAVQNQTVEQLIESTTLKVLNRPAKAEELALFTELLTPGFEQRVVPNARPVEVPRLPRNMVSWSNHLNPRANEIKVELQAAVRQGDPPTNQLETDWRERYEDLLWALLNSPEFIFIE